MCEHHQRNGALFLATIFQEKAKENMLILKSIDAVGKLTYADAVAIRDGKTNGEMKEAMKAYAEVKDELYEYLLEQNSKK